jgi:hypothetical protein
MLYIYIYIEREREREREYPKVFQIFLRIMVFFFSKFWEAESIFSVF